MSRHYLLALDDAGIDLYHFPSGIADPNEPWVDDATLVASRRVSRTLPMTKDKPAYRSAFTKVSRPEEGGTVASLGLDPKDTVVGYTFGGGDPAASGSTVYWRVWDAIEWDQQAGTSWPGYDHNRSEGWHYQKVEPFELPTE